MLQHVVGAMADDSRLLITEIVVGKDFTPLQAAKDLTMLAAAGRERTLAEFRTLLGLVGLKIINVDDAEGGYAMLECARA